MKMSEFMSLATAAKRADDMVKAAEPERHIQNLTIDEQNLVRAAIRRIMAERRDNLIERAGVKIEVEV